MIQKSYTDLIAADYVLLVDSADTLPVRFEISDGCERTIAFLNFDSVCRLHLQLGKWIVRYLNEKHERREGKQ